MSSSEIHPTAIVAPEARIGEGVQVGPYSVVGPHVTLGTNVRVGPHVVIEGHTTIGDESQVFQFASIGSAPQDLKFKGEPSTLEIGRGNVIREYVTLQPGTSGGHMKTVIGDGNLFMASSHVGHDCVVGNNNIFANSVALSGHVTVGNRVIFGGMVGVHQFARVGDFAFLSAGAMVGVDVPPYCMGQGDRCRLRGLNAVGLKRAGFSAQEMAQIKRTYRHLFSSKGGLKKKIEQLPSELAELPHIQLMTEFILGSERGICEPMVELRKEALPD